MGSRWSGGQTEGRSYKPFYGASWALVVGINEYQIAGRLARARNDAEALTSVLVKRLCFSPGNIVSLIDERATRRAIVDALDALVKKADTPDDRVLVFLAGHGTSRRGNRKPVGYFVPVDGDPDRVSTLIPFDDVTGFADQWKAKHVFFIVDACYGGLAAMRGVPSGDMRYLRDILRRSARQILAAGKADQPVQDEGPGAKNSLFTAHLLKGIEGDAVKEGILTANSLQAYVIRSVASDNRSTQTPEFVSLEGDGDFVLLPCADREWSKSQEAEAQKVSTADHMQTMAEISPEIEEAPVETEGLQLPRLRLWLYEMGLDRRQKAEISIGPGGHDGHPLTFGIAVENSEPVAAKGLFIRIAFSWRGNANIRMFRFSAPHANGWETRVGHLNQVQTAVLVFEDRELMCFVGQPRAWDDARVIVDPNARGYFLVHYNVATHEPLTQDSRQLKIYVG